MRKLSLSLAALALLSLVGLASARPAKADPIVACTTVNVQGYAVTARVVTNHSMSYTSVDPYNCEVGILVYGPVSITLDHINVNGHWNSSYVNVPAPSLVHPSVVGGQWKTVADVLVAGGANVTISNSALTGAQAGVFQDLSNVTLKYDEIASNDLGVYAYNKYTFKLNSSHNDVYDNQVGYDLYYSNITSSYDNIHENYYGGVGAFVSKGSFTHDNLYWNQGDGLFGSGAGTGSLTLKSSHVYGNGFGSACDLGDGIVFCSDHCVYVNFLWFTEEISGDAINFLTSGVEIQNTHANLDNTKVDQNYNGLEVDSDSSTINVYDFSHVCNNINLNFFYANLGYGTGFIAVDGTSSSCGA